jgi:hypothetical protein
MDLYSPKTWNRTIKRTIGKRYLFENQIYDSLFLRVESVAATAKSLDSIRPITLTVSYIDGFEDEVFSIVPGIKKPLTEFVTISKPVSYKLNIQNPNKSSIQVTVSTIKKLKMSSQQNPAKSDPAVSAALQALVAAQAATTAAVQAADESDDQFVTLPIDQQLSGIDFQSAVNTLNGSGDQLMREIVIANNNASGSLKIVVNMPAEGTKYADIPTEAFNPVEPGGSATISDPACRGTFYVIGSEDNMQVEGMLSKKLIPQAFQARAEIQR